MPALRSSQYLYTMLNLDSFPHVLNAALDTVDEEFLVQCSCVSMLQLSAGQFCGIFWVQDNLAGFFFFLSRTILIFLCRTI